MIAQSEGGNKPFVYALDERMKEITTLDKKLELPKNFNAKELYKNYYGVIMDSVKPCKVFIKVDADQVHYYESLPLHESQKIVEKTDKYSIFEYYLCPNRDFKHELLSKGESVEVLGPDWFRKEIKDSIKKMMDKYNN